MTPPTEAVGRELRHALRRLRRAPGFTALAAATLALGVGAASAGFSLVNGLLLRPPAGVAEPARLLTVQVDGAASLPNYRDLRAAVAGEVRLAAFADHLVAIEADGRLERVLGLLVSDDYFAVLGTRPFLGRLATAPDGPAGAPAAVVSHAYWRRALGADSATVGRTVRVNGHPVTVAGVAEPGFVGAFVGFQFDVWLPFGAARWAAPRTALEPRDADRLEFVGRLAGDASGAGAGGGTSERRARATAALAAAGRRLAAEHPEANRELAVRARPYDGFDETVRPAARGLAGILLALAVLVLAIATGNVANMALARGAARSRETALRRILGSGRGRLALPALAEGLLLAVPAALLGLGLAAAAARLLGRLEPALPVRLAIDLTPDLRVAGFAALAALLAAAAAALPSALGARARDPAAALAGGGGRHTGRALPSRLFVAAQVSLSALLLVCGGLFLRTLDRASRLDPGFPVDGILAAPFIDLALDPSAADAGHEPYRRLLDRVAARRGVEAAALAGTLPLSIQDPGLVRVRSGATAGREADPESGLEVSPVVVSHGYFETLGLPVRTGRPILDSDDADAPAVAVVDEATARRLWPGREAVGRRLLIGGDAVRIVGIVADARQRTPGAAPAPVVYLPWRQRPAGRMGLLIRTTRDAAAVGPEVRAALREVAPGVPPVEVRPLRELAGVALFAQRVGGVVGGVLGGLGLLLAAAGLYGIAAFSVGRRRRELGIRLAVGAPPRRLFGLVLADSVRLAAVGLLAGLLLAAAGGGLLRGLLHGISPLDPPTFAVVGLLLTAAAALGAFVPAWRAARTDPMTTLRAE